MTQSPLHNKKDPCQLNPTEWMTDIKPTFKQVRCVGMLYGSIENILPYGEERWQEADVSLILKKPEN